MARPQLKAAIRQYLAYKDGAASPKAQALQRKHCLTVLQTIWSAINSDDQSSAYGYLRNTIANTDVDGLLSTGGLSEDDAREFANEASRMWSSLDQVNKSMGKLAHLLEQYA